MGYYRVIDINDLGYDTQSMVVIIKGLTILGGLIDSYSSEPDGGAGIRVQENIAPPNVTIETCWIANNQSVIVGECSGSIVSDSYNLESPGNTCGLDLYADRYNVPDAGLGPLFQTPGGLLVQEPTATSPLVDPYFPFLPQPTCSGIDQRGVTRPQDGETDPDNDPDCDIGAVERSPGMIFVDGFECGFLTPWS